MGFNTRANDWEFAGICQLGGAQTVGGGVYLFNFRSEIAGVQEYVFFGGAGIGIGGNVGGGSGFDLSSEDLSYTPIQCVREFSLYDLHNALGRVTTIGVSLAIGYGQVYITASAGFDTLFESQGGHGLTVGVGVGATNFYGLWRVVSLSMANVRESAT